MDTLTELTEAQWEAQCAWLRQRVEIFSRHKMEHRHLVVPRGYDFRAAHDALHARHLEELAAHDASNGNF